mmetsp:Transcript_16326/g.32979  ORF Transcript_16326/g.32979 Transcript_16326/m.32979 type:complete len:103 (+) Transcript_16326:83-391(+)
MEDLISPPINLEHISGARGEEETTIYRRYLGAIPGATQLPVTARFAEPSAAAAGGGRFSPRMSRIAPSAPLNNLTPPFGRPLGHLSGAGTSAAASATGSPEI